MLNKHFKSVVKIFNIHVICYMRYTSHIFTQSRLRGHHPETGSSYFSLDPPGKCQDSTIYVVLGHYRFLHILSTPFYTNHRQCIGCDGEGNSVALELSWPTTAYPGLFWLYVT
jgi:hypothetical protein